MVFHIDLDGFPGRQVHFAIVDVQKANADPSIFLNREIQSFSAINATFVCQQEHLFVACMKAINREESRKKLITGNINKEVVYCLSPTKNLKEAMQLFAASSETQYMLLVCLEATDAITPFLNKNHIVEEKTKAVIQGEPSEEVKQKLITHFKLTKEELAIYPFNDLIQMGVKNEKEIRKQQEITLLQLKQVIKKKISDLQEDEVKIVDELSMLEKELQELLVNNNEQREYGF